MVAPDATVTDAGTVTVGPRSEVRLTTKPDGGAAALIVTVPVIVPPPYAGDGRMLNAVRLIALIVSVALCELLPTVAVIVADVFVLDVWVVLTVNVADFDPAGIETEEGTVAEAALDLRVTVVADDCEAERVTVPVDV